MMARILDPGAAEEQTGETRHQKRVAAPPGALSAGWAPVENLSTGGVCLAVAAPVLPGERYGLVLTQGLLHSSVAPWYGAQELQAEVIWYTGGRAGFRWVELSGRQQAWLRERIQDWQHRIS
jgi:PilZ domain-containing protein